jgi:hypothetical protein
MENKSQIESIIFDFERKQASLDENHHEQEQALVEEIRGLNLFLNQKKRRIQELENLDATKKNAIHTRDIHIKELEAEVSAFKKLLRNNSCPSVILENCGHCIKQICALNKN